MNQGKPTYEELVTALRAMKAIIDVRGDSGEEFSEMEMSDYRKTSKLLERVR